MTTSPYRLRAREIISAVLAQLPATATEADARKALRGRNPWPHSRTGDGQSWPSKCWHREVKEQLHLVFMAARQKQTPAWICRSYGVCCGWCGHSGVGKGSMWRGWNTEKSGCLICGGNPLKLSPSLLTWQDGLVVKLAKIIAGKSWCECEILADALEEAGCSDELILAHLRMPDAVHLKAGCGVVRVLAGVTQ